MRGAGAWVVVVLILTFLAVLPVATSRGEPASLWRVPPADSVSATIDSIAPVVTGTLSLDEALRFAASHHAGLTASLWSGRAEVSRARDEAHVARPTVEGMFENFGGGLGGSHEERTLTLAQPLDIGGRRGALSRVVTDLQLQANAELESQIVTVLREAADTFLQAWVLQRRVDLLARADSVGRLAIAAARERTRIGAAPATESLRAEGEWAQRGIERRRAQAELAEARLSLAALWGARSATFDSLALPSADLEPPALAESLDAQVERNPEVIRAASDSAVAAARLRVARAERFPELTLTGGARYLRELDATGFIAGVSLPLPLWNTGHDRIAAAEAEYQAAVARERAVRLRLRRELAGAGERMIAARDAISLGDTRALPAATQALEQLESGYRRGRFTYLDVAEGRRSLLDLELLLNDATRDYWQARLTLEGLTGGTTR